MRPVTPQDVLAFSLLSDVAISADGALVAFTRSDGFKTFQGLEKSEIWLARTDGSVAQPFTRGPRADWSPRWSPDGQTLAFLSDRENERTQVYVIARNGGEARRLTDVAGEIQELAWSPDGTQIGFLMSDPVPEEISARRKQGDDVIEFEQHHPWWRVWTVDVASSDLRQITTGDVHVWEFGWGPHGDFALVTGTEPYEWSWFKPAIAYVGAEGGTPQTVYSVPEKCFARPRITPDGQCIAFLSGIWSDRGVNAGELLTIRLEHADSVLVAQPFASSLSPDYEGSIWWYRFAPDTTHVDFLAYEQGEAAIGTIELASCERTTRWHGKATFAENSESQYFANNNTIALVRSDATTPQELWTFANNEWRQLTTINTAHAAELALGEQRTISWQSSDGQEIQGLLILPVGYTPEVPVPLITWVHGGPAWLYTHAYYAASRGVQAFAGAGYAVFLPNPRGSNGWGISFLEQNIGDFGGMDYQDIMSGIDWLIAQGIADGERLGIGGWSYGGFMAAWAITQTTRFKAAMVGAAITNWRSFHGAAYIGLWDRISLRANPYERGGIYESRSPISYVEQVTTPTLIQHGQNDRVVPIDQGYEFFRALKDRGVAVEMAIYPRSGHSINERAHQIDRMQRWLNWFGRYLGQDLGKDVTHADA